MGKPEIEMRYTESEFCQISALKSTKGKLDYRIKRDTECLNAYKELEVQCGKKSDTSSVERRLKEAETQLKAVKVNLKKAIEAAKNNYYKDLDNVIKLALNKL